MEISQRKGKLMEFEDRHNGGAELPVQDHPEIRRADARKSSSGLIPNGSAIATPTPTQARPHPRSSQNRLPPGLDQWTGFPVKPWLARPRLLHEIFEAQADARPENLAV